MLLYIKEVTTEVVTTRVDFYIREKIDMSVEKEKLPITNVPQQAQEAAKAQTAPPRVRRYRQYLFIFSLVVLASAFGVLTFFVKAYHSFPLDLVITLGIQSIHLVPFDNLLIGISWLGFWPQQGLIALVIIVIILFFGLQWEAMSTIIAAILSALLNVVIKDIIQRPRPSTTVVHVMARLNDFSFPSGHVMFFLGFYGFVGFLAFTLLKPSWIRTLILIVVGVLIGLVGVSRIFEGEHWASDVLGAYLLGTLTLIAIIEIYRWGKNRFFVHQPVAKPESPKK